MKKILIMLAVVLGIAATAAPKNKEADTKENNKAVAQEVWYEVDGSTETPSDLTVMSGPNTAPPNTSQCNINNPGLPCGAHLSFPNNDAPTSIPPGTTLQDLLDDYGASLVTDANNRPEFTRKD